MVYLEYDNLKKQVIQIHEEKPITSDGYSYAKSEDFKIGDEFEYTIWIDEVDEKNNLMSYSAIRNNPNAKRLLRENEELKQSQTDQDDLIMSIILGRI